MIGEGTGTGWTVSLVVFDLDGTLIDSRRDLADAANALVVERGGQPLSVDAVASMVGEGAALLVERALAAAGLPPDRGDALARFLALYDQRLLVHTYPYDGVPAALEALASRHRLRVLTNKPAHAAREILRGLDLERFFGAVIGGDGPHPRKPDPAGLLALAADAGCAAAETTLVGDSKIDLATARAAGARICIARYGFGFRPEEMPLRPGDLAVDLPSDLPRTLEPY